MKKRIGISFTRSNFQNYWSWFTKEDLQDDIELVILSFEDNNAEDISTCDGIILTGGVDIDDSLYSAPSEYVNKPTFQSERDKFEEKIFRYSQENDLPVLGICRGLQLVNILEKGNLIKDLNDANEQHKKEGTEDKEHLIRIEKDSLLHEIISEEEGKVNSAHHQGVDISMLGNNLQANAFADTGHKIVEGLEFKNKTGKAFMLCVQWHPERMKDKETNPLSKKIKERFLDEIRRSKRER